MKQTAEVKVGILVLAAIVGITWLTWKSGNMGTTTSSDEYSRYLVSNFDDVDGLVAGAKVRISGVTVGDVTDITLSKTGTASVHMYVDDELILPSNIVAQISSSGIIGEKFVSLSTDFAPEGVLSKENNKIVSKRNASVEDMADNFAKISADLEQVTSSLRSALGGKENSARLSRIVSSMDNIGSKLERVLVNEIEDGKVKGILDNFSKFSDSLGENGDDILVDLKSVSHSLKTLLENGSGDTSKLISNLGSAIESIANITAKIENGEGTIGRLVNETSTVDKIDEALDGFSQITNRMNSFRTEVDFYGYSLGAEEVGKGRFELTLQPRPTRYYVIGVSSDGFATESSDARSNLAFTGEDFGNELKYTAQFGHVYESLVLDKDIGFRIGIKDSTFGIGVDTAFWGNFVNIAADLYDFSGENSGTSEENPHLDLTAKVNLIDNALYAVGGYDNILSSKYGSPFIGLGFRFKDDDLKYMIGQAL